MRPTVWLASYPKSGNTWFRILLANLDPAREGARRAVPAEINSIDSTDSIASARERFEQHLLVDSSLLGLDEIDAMRPALYRHLATDQYEDPFDPEASYPVRFVKTHDGYTHMPDAQPLLGGPGAAAGALLFVRDPRDVASSLAHHRSSSIDDAIALMGDPRACFCDRPGTMARQLRQRLLGWSGFAASWLDQRDVPVRLVQYEALHSAPLTTIRAALEFAGRRTDDAEITRAIGFAALNGLQRQELAGGFREAPVPEFGLGTARPFFRRGVAGGWRDELTRDQILRIERDHSAMMERLGYLPATQEDFRYADQQAG